MPMINVLEMFSGDGRKDADFSGFLNAGVYGVIHRATQGMFYRDAAYNERRAMAKAAGVLWGASHMIDSSDPQLQADFFLEISGATSPDEIAVVCEFSDITNPATLYQVMAFMSAVDRALPNISTILYSSERIRSTLKPSDGGFQNPDMAGALSFFGKHRLWLAEQGPTIAIPPPWDTPQVINHDAPGVWLCQYTEKGRVNPVVGNSNGNFYNGTFEQLSNNWVQ